MRPVVVPVPRQALRALWPALPVGGALAVVALVLALADPGSEASDAAVLGLVVTLVVSAWRCVLWVVGPGRNGVWLDADGVVVRRWGLTTRVGWDSVERVSFASAPGRPEWSRWATFERTSLRRSVGRDVHVEVLALGSASLANARRLAAVCEERALPLDRV